MGSVQQEPVSGEAWPCQLMARPAQKPEELPAAAFGVLRDAARTRKVAPVTVEGALVYLETLAVERGMPSKYTVNEKAGREQTYRLIFSMASSLQAFRYIPVKVLLRVHG